MSKMQTYIKQCIDGEETHRKELEMMVARGIAYNNLKDSIKTSKLKQKIFIYMYNKNISKAQETLQKLKKHYINASDELTFSPENHVYIIKERVNPKRTDKNWVDSSNDGARKMLNEMKRNLEWFEENIAFVASLI
tara:strand:+ start:490 stop:897 length:408 start_codon:yes stop_codon:yes gene_type:complete